MGPELKSYGERKPFGLLKCEVKWNADGTATEGFSRRNCSEATADLASLIILSGAVHTRVEVHRMDSEMSGLVE